MNKAKDPLFNIVTGCAAMVQVARYPPDRDSGSIDRLCDCDDDPDRYQSDSGVCLHLFRGVRNGQKDMDYISECGNFAVDFAGIDTGIPDALLEHRGRGTGAGRRSDSGSLHDHTGR